MAATLIGIYTTAIGGTPLRSLAAATLEAGRGLIGDRYYVDSGTFSQKLKGKPDVEITLIESEEIARFNQAEGTTWTPGEFRRNLVTQGVRLNDLIGRRFRVGSTELEGIRLCEPCAHLAQLVSTSVVKSLVHRAGLRARIVVGGAIHPGDPITLAVQE